MALGTFGSLTKLTSAPHYLPYTSKVALNIIGFGRSSRQLQIISPTSVKVSLALSGHCCAQPSKIAHTYSNPLIPIRPCGALNPFFAIYSCHAVTRKMTSNLEVPNLKSLRLFSTSHEHPKGFLAKCTAFKTGLLQDHQISCFRVCMCALL